MNLASRQLKFLKHNINGFTMVGRAGICVYHEDDGAENFQTRDLMNLNGWAGGPREILRS